jgi:phage/plasmid-like protein (TIGR03299 family)
MAHLMETIDNAFYANTRAWHGLGITVEGVHTPTEALELAGLDWEVEQIPMTYEVDGNTFNVETHVQNIRSDTKTPLGVVGTDWTPFNNRGLAELAEACGETDGMVRCETFGTFRGGRRVYLLVDTNSTFDLPGGDTNVNYLMFATGHDGGFAVVGMGTSVRVVCNNTFQWAMSSFERDLASGKAFKFRHTTGILDRVEEAKRALKVAASGAEVYKTVAIDMANYQMTESALREFFLDAYTASYGKIPTNPKTAKEEASRRRAQERVGQWLTNFSEGQGAQLKSARGTLWGAFNAITEWSDHDRTVRKNKNARNVDEARMESNLFGSSNEFKRSVMEKAVAVLS